MPLPDPSTSLARLARLASTAEPAPPSTPNPPLGPRATALTTALSTALSTTLSAISYPSFAACFPTIAAQRETNLRAVHNQMISRLSALATSEFDSILAEREVVAGLNELDRVIAAARRRKQQHADGGGEGGGVAWVEDSMREDRRLG